MTVIWYIAPRIPYSCAVLDAFYSFLCAGRSGQLCSSRSTFEQDGHSVCNTLDELRSLQPHMRSIRYSLQTILDGTAHNVLHVHMTVIQCIALCIYTHYMCKAYIVLDVFYSLPCEGHSRRLFSPSSALHKTVNRFIKP